MYTYILDNLRVVRLIVLLFVFELTNADLLV